MDYTGYQLENAYLKMTERHQQAEKDALVVELKEVKRPHNIPAWRLLLGQSLIRLGQRLSPVVTR